MNNSSILIKICFWILDMRIEMDTMQTQKIRFLTVFYKKLQLQKTKDERLQLLTEIQQIMNNKIDNDGIILEIKTLFEREIRMLRSNVDSFHLVSLRERQQSLFLNMITNNNVLKARCMYV